MMNGFDGGMMSGPVFGWLLAVVQLLFWGGLLAVIVWAVARIFPSRRGGEESHGEPSEPAEEILRRRFARGEIDTEEYEERLRVLKGDAAARSTAADRR